jgi:hypothetical protein
MCTLALQNRLTAAAAHRCDKVFSQNCGLTQLRISARFLVISRMPRILEKRNTLWLMRIVAQAAKYFIDFNPVSSLLKQHLFAYVAFI